MKILFGIFAVIAIGAPASAADRTITTADGAQVLAPPPQSLSCAELSAQLGRVDATGYRSGQPEPTQGPNRELFIYESQLSVEFFWRCSRAEVDDDAARSGFSRLGRE